MIDNYHSYLLIGLLLASLGCGDDSSQLKSDTAANGGFVEESERVNDWRPFTEATLTEALSTDRVVLVTVVADWCLPCKQNERGALSHPDTVAFIRKHGVVTFVADWTAEDAAVSRLMDSLGESSVPLTVIYPTDRSASPVILNDVYRAELLLKKLITAIGTKPMATPAPVPTRN